MSTNSFHNFLIEHYRKFLLFLLPCIIIIYLYPFMWKLSLVTIILGLEGAFDELTKIKINFRKYFYYYHNIVIYIIIPAPVLLYVISLFTKNEKLGIPYRIIITNFERGINFISSGVTSFILSFFLFSFLYIGINLFVFYIARPERNK